MPAVVNGGRRHLETALSAVLSGGEVSTLAGSGDGAVDADVDFVATFMAVQGRNFQVVLCE